MNKYRARSELLNTFDVQLCNFILYSLNKRKHFSLYTNHTFLPVNTDYNFGAFYIEFYRSKNNNDLYVEDFLNGKR